MTYLFTDVQKSVNKNSDFISRVLGVNLKNDESRDISTPEIRDMGLRQNKITALLSSNFIALYESLGIFTVSSIISNNNFRNPFGYLIKNYWRDATKFSSNESLIYSHNFSNKHNSFHQQTRSFLFNTRNTVVSSFRCRNSLRSNSNQDNIFMRTIEYIGRNNKSWSLFESTEVSKRKWYEDNVATLIFDHILNLNHYSRNQMKDLQVLRTQVYQNQARSILVDERVIVVDPRAWIVLWPARFGLKTNFAYVNSISYKVIW